MSFCFKASFIHCRRGKIAWSFLHSYLIPAQDCEVIIVAMNPEKVCFPSCRMIDMFRGRKNLQNQPPIFLQRSIVYIEIDHSKTTGTNKCIN